MQLSDADYFDVKDALTVLRRQLRLIILTGAMFVTVAFLYLVQATPLFTATALVQVDPDGVNLLDSTQPTVNSTNANSRLESEVEILKSEGLALSTVQSNHLILDPEFGPSLGLFDKFKITFGIQTNEKVDGAHMLRETLGRFQDALAIRRRGLTYLIAVSLTADDPEKAASLANAHAKSYIDHQVNAKVAASLGARDVLQNQLDQARQSLAASDTALSDFIDQNLMRLEAESGSEKVAELRRLLEQTNLRYQTRLQTTESAQSALAVNDWSTLAATVGDAAVANLASQRQEILNRLEGADLQDAAAIDLADGLARIEAQLGDAGKTALSSLESEMHALEDTSTSLREDLRREVLTSTLSPLTLSEIYSLQQEAQIAQRQYDTLLSRMREIETQALIEVADSTLVSEALPPLAPSFPNRTLVIALALFGGLGAGIGLAFLYEFFLGGITSASQLTNIVPARVAAVIPRVLSNESEHSVADRIHDEPMSLFSESFRRMRAAIDNAVPDVPNRGKVIMVTSSIPAEGKSIDALALARTYALAGKRTLLIDADLRKPGLYKLVGANTELSILDYLMNPAIDGLRDEFFAIDPKSPAVLMLGHESTRLPTDAPLQSNAFRKLIENACHALDVVIIDTAPLVPVVDANYVAPLVDCAVLCVRFGVTMQSDIRSAFEQLGESITSGAPILTALNCFEGGTVTHRYAGYYGYVS